MLQQNRLLRLTGLAALLLTACAGEPPRDISPWSRLLASESGQMVLTMALDPRGEPVVAGPLLATPEPDFEMDSSNHGGVFVTSMSDTGDALWSTLARGGPETQAHRVAIAPNGDVLLLGLFRNTFTLGGQKMTATEDIYPREPFLARFDPRGQLLWLKQFPKGSSDVKILAPLATNANGDAIVGERSEIISFDADGNHLWTHTLSSPDREVVRVRAVSVDAFGAIFVAGDDEKRDNSSLFRGGFITKLAPGGQQLFTVPIRGETLPGYVQITTMAASPSGNVVLSGNFMKPITFGSMKFDSGAPVKFVAGISSAGEPGWLGAVQSSNGGVEINALAVAPGGRVYVTGRYEGDELSIGGLTLGPTSGTAMFLVELDGRGKATDGRLFDNAGAFKGGPALAVDPMGALLLAGHFIGQIDLDDKTLTSEPLGSSFVARLALPFASHRRE